MKDSNEYLYFSQHVRRIRIERKMTQKEMADRLGIGVRTLSRIERGILPRRLSCEILFRVQEQFGICPQDLFKPVSPH